MCCMLPSLLISKLNLLCTHPTSFSIYLVKGGPGLRCSFSTERPPTTCSLAILCISISLKLAQMVACGFPLSLILAKCYVILTPSFSEFQGLLYDLMKQAVVGGLEVDEVVSFLSELIEDIVVRWYGKVVKREESIQRPRSVLTL